MLDLLNPDHHAALIANLEFIAAQTNIPVSALRGLRAKDICTEAEMLWVKDLKRNLKLGQGGLIFSASNVATPLTKCLAIGATLIRNDVDARLYSVSTLLNLMDAKKELPNPTVLVIPDLCVSEFSVQKWQIPKLYGFLLERFAANKMIVGYIDSLSTVEKNYGNTLAEFIGSHYLVSEPEAASA